MKYNKLGNTGLLVSCLAYGNAFWNSQKVTHEEQVKIIKTCLQNGINTFDTAQIYGYGKDQQYLGKVLKEINEPREHYVLTTKVWTAPNSDMNSTKSTNRKHIKQSVRASLKRLQQDYVDIVFAHSYDATTPIEQIVRAFHQVIQQGYAFYWATSNWDADKVFQAFQICEKYNLHKPIACQNQYNMLNREDIESDYRTLFEKYGYGLLAYSPLAGGQLTGKKFAKGDQQGGRFENNKAAQFRWQHGVDTEKSNQIFEQLKQIAEKQLNTTMTALAVAWVIKFKHTSSALFGARNAEQVKGCLQALSVLDKLTPEVEGRINKILANQPAPRMDFRKFAPTGHIRPKAQ